MSLRALRAEIEASGFMRVVITGGEPLESPAFAPLVFCLKAIGRHVEVETAGTEVPHQVPVDQWNVSLKLANSGVPDERRLRPAAIAHFRDLDAWFKFVVGDERDVDEVMLIQRQYGLPSARILLMPLGMRREEQLALSPRVVEWCRRFGFRFSPRLQIMIYGPRRGI